MECGSLLTSEIFYFFYLMRTHLISSTHTQTHTRARAYRVQFRAFVRFLLPNLVFVSLHVALTMLTFRADCRVYSASSLPAYPYGLVLAHFHWSMQQSSIVRSARHPKTSNALSVLA